MRMIAVLIIFGVWMPPAEMRSFPQDSSGNCVSRTPLAVVGISNPTAPVLTAQAVILAGLIAVSVLEKRAEG